MRLLEHKITQSSAKKIYVEEEKPPALSYLISNLLEAESPDEYLDVAIKESPTPDIFQTQTNLSENSIFCVRRTHRNKQYKTPLEQITEQKLFEPKIHVKSSLACMNALPTQH